MQVVEVQFKCGNSLVTEINGNAKTIKEEYTPLANELKSLGYDLTIMNKDI